MPTSSEIMEEVLKGLDVLHPDGLIEARGLNSKGFTVSGYYKDREKLAQDIMRYPKLTWYAAMNRIADACYAREQCEALVEKPKSTTGDKEITDYDWILIDVDPIRVTGVSATEQEKESAHDVINRIYKFLAGQGFSKPVGADSGNGYHLLYKVDIPIAQTDGISETVSKFLKVLDMYFSTDKAQVDTQVFNPSRITKLYGTIAHKGADSKERPHRQSKILMAENPVKVNSITLIQKVASQWHEPVQQRRTYGNTHNPFDAKKFLQEHGVEIAREASYGDGTKLVLAHCPFDENHKAPDSAVFLHNDGSIGFKCFHNSCEGRKWRDVRLLLDPNAYQSREDQFRVYQARPIPPSPNPTQEPKPQVPEENHFLRMKDIVQFDRSKIVSIQSGIRELDKKILGFNKGEMSVWSGSNGSGKSTFLSQQTLETINAGYTVAMFSGELTSTRMKNWLYLQAAGASGVNKSPNGITWYVPKEIQSAIEEWMNDKLWLYNNEYGNKSEMVLRDFEKHMQAHKTDVVVIDNLMSLSYSQGANKYDAQTELVLRLSAMAKKYDVHIHFVCHPRKPNGFLRKADISGTNDITNAADNVFMMHRVNEDFMKGAAEFFGSTKAKAFKDYGNVLEVMKNRDLGVQDELIGLYYAADSKQLQNERNQNRGYGWLEKYSDCPF
jgi:archaellum biogenesis ATPase FlaH